MQTSSVFIHFYTCFNERWCTVWLHHQKKWQENFNYFLIEKKKNLVKSQCWWQKNHQILILLEEIKLQFLWGYEATKPKQITLESKNEIDIVETSVFSSIPITKKGLFKFFFSKNIKGGVIADFIFILAFSLKENNHI